MTRPTAAQSGREDITQLVDTLNQVRVEIAETSGGMRADLRHIQDSIRELNGLFAKVSSLETGLAVADSRQRDLEKTVQDWHDDGVTDRARLHQTDERQDRYIYVGVGLIVAAQAAAALFGPAIRTGLHLP